MHEPKNKRAVRDAPATREPLRDAAEALFANNGDRAVSVRESARHAQVDLAAATEKSRPKARAP